MSLDLGSGVAGKASTLAGKGKRKLLGKEAKRPGMNSHAHPRGDSYTEHHDSAAMNPDRQRRTTGRTRNQALYLFFTPPCAPPLVTIKGRGGQRLQGLDFR
jgi:hypothetical protein